LEELLFLCQLCRKRRNTFTGRYFGEKAIFDKSKIEFVMDFIETATSDPNLKIHMYIFRYNGVLEGELTISNEIERFMWFGVDDTSILSNTLKNKIIPYALEQGLIYKNKKSK